MRIAPNSKLFSLPGRVSQSSRQQQFQMGKQKLRQPEFSEDSPWLPTWLQPEWSAFAEQTMSSHPICETECKGLEGFPKSMEYLEEAINGTTTEVVTRQICPLFLSGDDCTATEKSQSPEIALALRLSFSSEDNSECCATKFIEGPPQEAYQSHVVLENHISVPNTQLEFAGKTNQNMHPIPSATHFIGMEEDPMCGKVLSECKILSQSYTQQTPCTELYVPGIIQQENNLNDTICGAGYDLAYVSRSSELLTIRTSPSSLDGTLGSESCVPGQTVMENVQNSLKRQSRKRKSIDRSEGQLSDKITDSKLTTVDIDVAIGLTVAAAEALVISNLMDTCMLSESIGRSEILEAALKLKQARQICGLDSFLGVSTEPVNDEDSSLDDLDDSIMEEAFADVGLFELENIVSPVGACCADALRSDDTEEHSHGNMPSFLSKKEELINDFDEREFKPSKQELETNGSDSREDNGVIFSKTTVSFPDTSISKCLTSVEGVEDQQRYSMERLHASLEHAGGELFIHSMDAKPSGIGICVANVTGKSENSLSRNMGIIGSQEKPSSPVCRKCNEGDSFQSEFLSMDKLVHDSNKRQNAAVETAVGITHFNKQFDTNGNAAVETAAGNTHSNKQIDTIDKETNCACPTEDAVLIQSSVTCSPSWLSLTGDRVKEIVSFDVSQSSDSLEWQSQIQAEISGKKESEKSHDTTVTRILSVESPRPFNSRWFGGWAGLGKEAEKNKTFEATMCVQKPFVEETSYLTESLDMDIGHPTSVKYHSGEALKQPSNADCDFLDMDIQDLSSSNKVVCDTLSQSSVRGTNSPLYDPLCSFVPCSLDQEDALLNKNTDLVHSQGMDPVLSSKVHADTSLQLFEILKPLQKESTTQSIADCFLSASLSLNKPSQQWHNNEMEHTRTSSIGGESQVCTKRKRVDSLEQYSTGSRLRQNGSIDLPFESKDLELSRSSVMIDSMKGLKRDYHSDGNVTSIKEKENIDNESALPKELAIQGLIERLASDCANANTVNDTLANSKKIIGEFADYDMLEFEPLPLTKVVDCNALHERDPSCGKQCKFQDQCKSVATIHDLTFGDLGEYNAISTTHKSSCNLLTGLEVRLDVEESSPLVLDCRKRRRLRAYKTIESGTEDSNWDKNTSISKKHSVAAVSHNTNDFEPAKNLCHFPDLNPQESIEHSSSKLQGGGAKIKKVHFSEDISKIQEDVNDCQNGPLQNTSTQFFQTHEVCRSVREKTNNFVTSLTVQNAKVGKKMREGNSRKDKRENAQREVRFEGMEFLLTGLSKNKKNKLEALIRKHGGIVLLSLPSFSYARVRGIQKTQCSSRKCPIIISAQQVRTTKFLYGCAVGSLLLQPGWIIDSIAAKCCLPYDKYLLKSKVSNVCQWLKQKHYDTTENGIPLFRGIRIMLYGKPTFCSKLMILIKHAGGQVFRTIKSLVQGCEYTKSASAMIVVEDERAAPRNLRQCASEYRIPLMSGNWIIESLLLGRLLPFRTNTSSGSQSSGKRGHLRNSLIKKSPDCWNRSEPNAARLLGSNNTGADHLISSKDVKGPSRKEDTLYKASTIICGLEVSVTTPAVPKLGIMLPRKYAEHSAKQQQGSNCLYYKQVAFNDVLYSIGDVVELVPISEAEETHLARIECLWSVKAAKVKSRLKKRNEVANSCERLFLQCRWFYRPSDTGFPCTGSGNEIYVSNCFKDISVQKIIKKVSVVFMVDGKIFPMNATNEKGDPSSCISEDEQTTDFICKFFYDYENESLHQLKI